MSRKFTERQLELITAYADGCTDTDEKSEVETLISTDADYKALLELELATKSFISKRLKRVNPPSNMLQNIHTGIDKAYADSIKNSIVTSETKQNVITSTIVHPGRNFSKYYYFSIAAVVLIIAVIGFKVYNGIGAIPINKNYEIVSRRIFDQIQKGEVKVEYATNNPKDLQKYFEGKTDFKVFVPDVKDAELVGGMVNEIEGQKIVHFVHRCKDGKLIYTMEGGMSATKKSDHLMIDDPCIDKLQHGTNFFESNCGAEGNTKDNIVLWSQGDCLCSSVSQQEPKTIAAVLTNYK